MLSDSIGLALAKAALAATCSSPTRGQNTQSRARAAMGASSSSPDRDEELGMGGILDEGRA